MIAFRKRSDVQIPNDAAEQPTAKASLGLAGLGNGPGINIVAEHTERLEAAFVQQYPARHSGAVRAAVIFGGSGLLWACIALVARTAFGN